MTSSSRAACAGLLLALVPAAPSRGADAEEILFEQVLAEPDDAELNYRFALQRVGRGRLLNALPALERVLAASPDHHEARLVYALVLYRLDSLDAAAGQLALLSALPLGERLKSQLDDLSARIRSRRSRGEVGGYAGVGMEHHSNRNAAPRSGQTSIFDIAVPLVGDARRRADTALALSAGLEARRDLGRLWGPRLHCSFDYYRAQQSRLTTIELDAYAFTAGATFRLWRADLTPLATYERLSLARKHYLATPGVGLRAERVFGRLSAFAEARDSYQEFDRSASAPAADERNGPALELSAGAEYALTPSLRPGVSYARAVKRAARRYNAYERDGATASLAWLPGQGAFAQAFVGAHFDRYREPDAFVSANYRKDGVWRFGVNAGLPLPLPPRRVGDWLFRVNYEYQVSRSNLRNYSFEDHKVGTWVSYHWRLGF